MPLTIIVLQKLWEIFTEYPTKKTRCDKEIDKARLTRTLECKNRLPPMIFRFGFFRRLARWNAALDSSAQSFRFVHRNGIFIFL
jgi:hypothetical protein